MDEGVMDEGVMDEGLMGGDWTAEDRMSDDGMREDGMRDEDGMHHEAARRFAVSSASADVPTRRFVGRTRGARRPGSLRLALALIGVLGLGAVGCSDKSRRLSGGEIQSYKLSLMRDHEKDLTEEHQYRFLRHPGRTEGELDEALEQYIDESEQYRERQRTRALRDFEGAAGRIDPGSTLEVEGPEG